jgi:hypothetical protein
MRNDVMRMCHLAYFPPGVMPVLEHLENGARLNPHGSGFAIGAVRLRSMDPERAISLFMRLRARHPDRPAVLHSRNATGDSPVTLENIHPFRSGSAVVFHNGYLFPHDGGKSDTAIFAEEVLPRYDLDNRADVTLLEERMGPNKAVVLHPAGKVTILNGHLGIALPDGAWHSNTDYLGIPHHLPGICPQCAEPTGDKPVCASCEEQAQGRRALLMRGTS